MAPRIPALHVGQGTYAGGLSLFPVWVGSPAVTSVAIGAESDGVAVAEREGHPLVGELVVENLGPRPVALLEGDLLEGGWQDRTLTRSVLLRPQERRVVEVCCVEQGRWSGGRGHGRTTRRVSSTVLGASRGHVGGRQHEVWERVARFETVAAPSRTGALRDHLDEVRADRRLTAFRPLDGQRGVIVGVMGIPVALEVFADHETLLRRWAALVEAAALDARLGPPLRTTGEAARRFAERVERTVLHREPEGPGRRVSSDRPGVSVRGLTLDDEWLHLNALATNHPLLVGA